MRLTPFVFAAPLLFVTTLAAAQTPTAPPPEGAAAAPAPPAPPPPAAVRPAPVPFEHAPAEPVDEDRSVYISISPLHLIGPIVELTGEVRVHRHIGLAIIGGYGSLKVEPLTERYKVWEVGGQFVGYPVGHFDHGLRGRCGLDRRADVAVDRTAGAGVARPPVSTGGGPGPDDAGSDRFR